MFKDYNEVLLLTFYVVYFICLILTNKFLKYLFVAKLEKYIYIYCELKETKIITKCFNFKIYIYLNNIFK